MAVAQLMRTQRNKGTRVNTFKLATLGWRCSLLINLNLNIVSTLALLGHPSSLTQSTTTSIEVPITIKRAENEPTADTRIGPRIMMWHICMKNLCNVAFTGAIAANSSIKTGPWSFSSYHWGLFQRQWRSNGQSRSWRAPWCGRQWLLSATICRFRPSGS